MINKFYKQINSKFSRFFKLFFFIRYLFLIFFVALILFFSIPKFFDYKEKETLIKSYLFKNYRLDIKSLENIKYSFFPLPRLEINNVESKIYPNNIDLKTKNLVIYPKIFGIYNYSNFKSRKIKLEKNKTIIDIKNINQLIKNISNLEKKLFLQDVNIIIKDNLDNIAEIKKVNFNNYGFDKNKIYGELFNSLFEIKINKDTQQIYFKLLDTGISGKFNIYENNPKSPLKGGLKGKILQSNFKFDFIFNGDFLEIKNFLFRGKEISLDSTGRIDIKPFFQIILNSEIRNINKNFFKNLDLYKIFEFKEFIKKINGENNITFKSKKFSRNIIKGFNLDTKLIYGRLSLSKEFLIANSVLFCSSKVNLIEEYPVFNFDCNLTSPDKKEFLKKMGLSYEKKNEKLSLQVKGNLNIFNNKINFYQIKMNNSYNAKNEDLKYFKNIFEKILFNESFVKIFSLIKIQNFISEIS